jgi:hypothetical protein
MIVGCYSLDLYCDNYIIDPTVVEDKWGHRYDDFPDQFTGFSRAECVRNARRRGWIVNICGKKAYCPKCAGLRKRKRIAQNA